MAWDDFATAVKVRDLIRSVSRAEVDRTRPGPRYAVVDTVNLTAKTANVTYTGEAVSVPISFGGVVPSVGAKVRIEGPSGARYIADVHSIPWVAPTLTNGWLNYGTYAVAGYHRDKNGYVHLKGLLKSGTNTTTAFTLPAGYRPAERRLFAAMCNAGASQIMGYVDILTDGQVVLSGGTTWFAIDGITFRAEA
jgi:hypothetical protein